MSMRWYVLERMIWVFSSLIISGVMPLILALVAQNINAGVLTSPWGVTRSPNLLIDVDKETEVAMNVKHNGAYDELG